MKLHLTDGAVAALQIAPGKDDDAWWDDVVPGFGVRLRGSGHRTFVFQYKVAGATRRLVIGRVGGIKVARAREIAGELHAQVRLGRNPAAEKHAAIQRERHTFGALARDYLAVCRHRPNTLRNTTRALLKYAAPLHNVSVDAIDQRAIAQLLARIDVASGAVTANRLRSTLSALYSWALREGLATSNPVVNTIERPEQARDRTLTDRELRQVWHALPESNFGDIVKLLILTGQRAREISDLRWSEIVDGRIELPRERVKNNRAHTIPLGPAALAILNRQVQRPDCKFLFGRRLTASFSDWAQCKRRLDARIAEINGTPLKPWVIHDLRRSVATGMADLGIPPHIIEQVLNHQSGSKRGVAGIYNRSSYAKEKVEALAKWDVHVTSLVSGWGNGA
jgi:integrase